MSYHYTRDGHGIIEAVCKMFERGTFILGEGDALLPVQEAYLKYREAREEFRAAQREAGRPFIGPVA